MSRTTYLLLALLAVTAVSLAAISIFDLVTGDVPYSSPQESRRLSAEVEEALEQLIYAAEREVSQAIDRRASGLSEFIDSKKSGVQSFSEDVVSWRGKWEAIKPYIPLTKSEGDEKFIFEKFGEHIFTTADSDAAVRRAFDGIIKDIEGIENELAVAQKQELLGHSLSPNVSIVEAEFKEAVERMIEASRRDAEKAVGSLVVSEVAASVTNQVFVRIGVSSGIIATGAANSWWTYGASLVVGVVVVEVWEWIDDPAGDIEREMNLALDDLSFKVSAAFKVEMQEAITLKRDLWKRDITGVSQ